MSEAAVAGIYWPPLLLYLLAALPPFVVARALLARFGVLRRVWHPALFELAMLSGLIALLLLLL